MVTCYAAFRLLDDKERVIKRNAHITQNFLDTGPARRKATVLQENLEIFLPKDDRGTIMDSHEIRVDLCRAIRKLQHDGYTIMKVYPAMGDRRESIDVLSMPEFIQSAKCPDNDVEEAVIFSYFESGATFQLPCKVNKETHEIFDVTCAAMPCDDDCFSYAEVEINGKDYPVNFIDDILSENNADDALDEFYRIQQTGEYWQPAGNKTLDNAIHECRWAILKDALMQRDNKTLDDAVHECRWAILKDTLMQRGHDAVADFIGTDVSSDSYERLLDETEAQMPDEEFERFWEKYI